MANGTDAIALALRAAGLHPGDEVITTAFSAYPTTVGILQSEAVPVFADVHLEDGLIDPSRVEAALTTRTRALVPVHLYGAMAAADELAVLARKRGLALIEDCAQAHGASLHGRPAGSFGPLAAWSFYPTKNLGAFGDGGAVTCQSAEHAERLQRLRNYGQRNRYQHVERGWNSRLDPLQAALLAVKLRTLAAENERRRQLAQRYLAGLAGLGSLTPLRIPAGCTPSRHLFAVRLHDPSGREALQRALAERGVETLIHYPIAMPDQQATGAALRRGEWPNARLLAASVLSLPLHPELADEQIDHVIDSLRATP